MPATCTPEGQPLLCRTCQRTVIVEPSVLAQDVCCPRCGSLNWMAELSPAEWIEAQTWLRSVQRSWWRKVWDRLLRRRKREASAT